MNHALAPPPQRAPHYHIKVCIENIYHAKWATMTKQYDCCIKIIPH